MKSLPILLLCALALTASACAKAGASEEPLRFSAIPDEVRTDLKERFAPVCDHLSKELGVPVEFVPMESYSALVEAFKGGDVQLGWFGGLTGVRARGAVPGARAIVQGKVDPVFKSYFIANASTGLQPSESFPMGMRGMSFTFGEEASTSGRLMPEYFIRKETGESPEEFFGMANAYSGGHDKTATLVEAGTFQCGALNFKKYDQLVADGKLDPAKCVKIWTTPTYADYNWTAHPILDQRYGAGFTDRLQAALIGMQDPGILTSMMRPEGFIKASNDDFAGLAELAKTLNLVR